MWITLFVLVCLSKGEKDALFGLDTLSPYDVRVPGSDIAYTMVPVPAGMFAIGSSEADEAGRPDERPQKSVIMDAFWIGATEVTHDALNAFLQDKGISQNVAADAVTRPSPQYIDFSWGMGKQGGYPANGMSQKTALMYCRWLYEKTGIFYRLPTEAEWEYACRAGSSDRYFFSNEEKELADYAWYASNSEGVYHKTGEKKPNPWGLYDMLGNVMEWTLDHYMEQRYQHIEDQNPPPYHQKQRYPKALRGGGFEDEASDLRSARRFYSSPEWNRRDPQVPKSRWWLTEGKAVGFRLVRPGQQPNEASIRQFFTTFLE